MRASKFNTLVTTYEYIIKDKAVLSKVIFEHTFKYNKVIKFRIIFKLTSQRWTQLKLYFTGKMHFLFILNSNLIPFRSAGSTWSSTRATAWRTTTASWRRSWTRTTPPTTVCCWPERRCKTNFRNFGRCSTSCCPPSSAPATPSSSGSTRRSPSPVKR